MSFLVPEALGAVRVGEVQLGLQTRPVNEAHTRSGKEMRGRQPGRTLKSPGLQMVSSGMRLHLRTRWLSPEP